MPSPALLGPGQAVAPQAHIKGNEAAEHTRNALDLLGEAEDIACNWRAAIDSVLEIHKDRAYTVPDAVEPLPEWALKQLGALRDHRQSSARHREHVALVAEVLLLASGRGPSHVYEIWTERGHRLEVRHESYSQAAAALAKVDKARFPDAFVSRVAVHPFTGGCQDPTLLDTLIGRVYWGGVQFGSEGDRHHIQDQTGRTLYVRASDLIGHPVFGRMSAEGQERVSASIVKAKKRAALRQEAQP